MTHYAAHTGDVALDTSTFIQCQSWQATEWCEPLDKTNRGSAGFRELSPGVTGLDVSGKCFWDSILAGDPPLIRCGDTVFLTLDLGEPGISLQAWCLISEVGYSSDTEGLVELDFKALSVGEWEFTPACTGGGFSSGFSSGFFVCH